MGHGARQLAVEPIDVTFGRAAEASGGLDHRLQDRIEVERGPADDPQNRSGRGLLGQHLPKLAAARLQFAPRLFELRHCARERFGIDHSVPRSLVPPPIDPRPRSGIIAGPPSREITNRWRSPETATTTCPPEDARSYWPAPLSFSRDSTAGSPSDVPSGVSRCAHTFNSRTGAGGSSITASRRPPQSGGRPPRGPPTNAVSRYVSWTSAAVHWPATTTFTTVGSGNDGSTLSSTTARGRNAPRRIARAATATAAAATTRAATRSYGSSQITRPWRRSATRKKRKAAAATTGRPTSGHTKPTSQSPLRRAATTISMGKMPASTGAVIVPMRPRGLANDSRSASISPSVLRKIPATGSTPTQNRPARDVATLRQPARAGATLPAGAGSHSRAWLKSASE